MRNNDFDGRQCSIRYFGMMRDEDFSGFFTKGFAILLICVLFAFSCFAQKKEKSTVTLHILGTIQDGGAPHAGCKKDCCRKLFLHPDPKLKVVSLGLVDHGADKTWLFEATPDFTTQAKVLRNLASAGHIETPDGIFLTHAHVGHYTGLMYLGKEAMNASAVPVLVMPKMKVFLEQNGPWSQLVSLKNIALYEMSSGDSIQISKGISVKPLIVPHRDECSETVGFLISGPNKKALFIPDIDKWEKWKTDINEVVRQVDYAFIDGTFYDGNEIGDRDISTIPHPFIIESMELFKSLPDSQKKKIYFIHFNHTNPVIREESTAYKQVLKNGFNVARMGMEFGL